MHRIPFIPLIAQGRRSSDCMAGAAARLAGLTFDWAIIFRDLGDRRSMRANALEFRLHYRALIKALTHTVVRSES